MLDWSLLSGPIPVVLRLSAVVAALWVLSRTLRARRRLWVRWAQLIACLLVAAVVTAVVAYLARNVWMLYPDNLGPAIYLWSGAAVFAVNLTVTRVVTERNVGRAVVGVTAAVVVVAACANQVNAIYGAYVSPRDALRWPQFSRFSNLEEPRSIRSCLTRRGSQALRHGWSALGCEDWSLQRRLLVGATGQLPQRSVRRGLRREGRDDFGGPVVPDVDVATPTTTRAWTPSTCVTWGTATPRGPTRFTGPSS